MRILICLLIFVALPLLFSTKADADIYDDFTDYELNGHDNTKWNLTKVGAGTDATSTLGGRLAQIVQM